MPARFSLGHDIYLNEQPDGGMVTRCAKRVATHWAELLPPPEAEDVDHAAQAVWRICGYWCSMLSLQMKPLRSCRAWATNSLRFGALVFFLLIQDEAVCLRQRRPDLGYEPPAAETKLLRRGQHHDEASRDDTRTSTRPAFVRISRNATAIGGDGSKPSAEGTRLLCALRDAVQFEAPLWERNMFGGSATETLAAVAVGGNGDAKPEEKRSARQGEKDGHNKSLAAGVAARHDLHVSSAEAEGDADHHPPRDADNVDFQAHDALLQVQHALEKDEQGKSKITVSYRPPLPRKSCAIVSNSGAMLFHEYGEEIDSHDFILRQNRGPTRGFEKHVGSRESIRAGWDSETFVRHFCAQRMANKESPSTSLVGVEEQGQTQEQQHTIEEQADATVYVTMKKIPDPECTDMLAKKAALVENPSAHSSIPTMETFQNVGLDKRQIERFLLDTYGKEEVLKGTETKDVTTGAIYGVMLLGYCQYVDFYELAPSTAALDAKQHYYPGPLSMLEGNVKRPTTSGEPWGRGAETTGWHGLIRVEHDFFRRVASTPGEESVKTGKLRIPGLATLTEKDCG